MNITNNNKNKKKKVRNQFEISVQMMIFAAGTVIAMLFIGMMMEQYRSVKSYSDAMNQRVIEQTERLSVADILQYDNTTVNGADVTYFMNRYLGDFRGGNHTGFSVRLLDTEAGRDELYKDATMLSKLKDEHDHSYILPSSEWKCHVDVNANRIIEQVQFELVTTKL